MAMHTNPSWHTDGWMDGTLSPVCHYGVACSYVCLARLDRRDEWERRGSVRVSVGVGDALGQGERLRCTMKSRRRFGSLTMFHRMHPIIHTPQTTLYPCQPLLYCEVRCVRPG